MSIRLVDDEDGAVRGDPTGGALGIDVGATLCKIVSEPWNHSRNRVAILSRDLDAIAAFVAKRRPTSVALTGGGAGTLRQRLSCSTTSIEEFPAWCRGARALVRHFEALEPQVPFLLVSLGTGTLVFKVKDEEEGFVASCALGGAAIGGLGQLLSDGADFDALCELAVRGDRAKVDLFVADVYPQEKFPLPRSLTASSFGRVTRQAHSTVEDRIAALMRMVGESVALLCVAYAKIHDVRHVVIGGSAVQKSGVLRGALKATLLYGGCRAMFLQCGDYTGAVGALSLMKECQ
jgi:type II pantothenate kinase